MNPAWEENHDIGEVLRELGKDAVVHEADAAGLKPQRGRLRCPFEGCRDKAESEKRDTVSLYPGGRGETRLHCWRCDKDGSLIDLVAAARGLSELEAIAHVKGLLSGAFAS